MITTHTFAAFHSESFKEASEMSVRGNLRTTLADFSPTGSVYMATFLNEDGSPDSTCSTMNTLAGAYVNYCFVVESYAFKFQIVSGMHPSWYPHYVKRNSDETSLHNRRLCRRCDRVLQQHRLHLLVRLGSAAVRAPRQHLCGNE